MKRNSSEPPKFIYGEIQLFVFVFTTLSYTIEKNYFIYSDAQAMGGYALAGLGIRTQKNIHSFDFSGNICPLNPPTSLHIFHLRSLYLVYPKQAQFYFGGGLGVLNEPETIKISGSVESVIGYQWKNQVFLEANAIIPLKQSQRLASVWPGLTLGFGF